jgi:hypothetical protein
MNHHDGNSNTENNGAVSPSNSQPAVSNELAHLTRPAATFYWAMDPEDSRILDTAMRNSQAMFVHLQNAHLYYTASVIERMCNRHHLFNDPSLVPVDKGSIDEVHDPVLQQHHARMNTVSSKIKFLKNHMKALDAHCECRGAFPIRRRLTTANYIHQPYFVDSERAAKTKQYVDKHRTTEERAEQRRQLRLEQEELQRQNQRSLSPQEPSPHTQRYSGIVPEDERCNDHEDPGYTTLHRPEDCPKKGKQVRQD